MFSFYISKTSLIKNWKLVIHGYLYGGYTFSYLCIVGKKSLCTNKSVLLYKPVHINLVEWPCVTDLSAGCSSHCKGSVITAVTDTSESN